MRPMLERLAGGITHSSPSNMNNTPTTSEIGLNTTCQFEDYLRKKFRALLRGDEIHVPFPTAWTLDLLSEVDRIALILVKAFRNPSEIIRICIILYGSDTTQFRHLGMQVGIVTV